MASASARVGSATPRTGGFDVRFTAAELVEIDVLQRSIWIPSPSTNRGRKAASPSSELPAQQEGVPTGPLKFTAKAYRQQKRRWSEVKGAFAGRIDEIVDALEAMAASAAAVRQESERWDQQWRDAVQLHYSYGGSCSPITDQGEGFTTEAQARDTGILKALARFPRGQGDPETVRSELQALGQKLEGVARQPTPF